MFRSQQECLRISLDNNDRKIAAEWIRQINEELDKKWLPSETIEVEFKTNGIHDLAELTDFIRLSLEYENYPECGWFGVLKEQNYITSDGKIKLWLRFPGQKRTK